MQPGAAQPGDVIGERYRLLRLLDVGGMGEVWAARNELTRKNFAIKFLLPSLAERPDALDRFIREAETAGRLDHPAIVNVFDVAQSEDGRPFIVMELLSGESLDARLDRDGTLSELEAAAFLSQIAAGLEVAHGAGIVHRDLSLANVFLSRNPEGGRPIPKILDFGVSKTLGPHAGDYERTGQGVVLGCPEFMSPEQAQGAEAVDARTDVWSLGVVLYRCLTGAAPFTGKNYNALIIGILTRPHRPVLELAPNLDRELAAVVEGCLVKEREQRIQTAREVGERLAAIALRLGGGTAIGQRRRATDRVSRTPHFVALGVEELRALARLRARPSVIAAVSGCLGVLIGASAVLGLRTVNPEPAVAPASTPATMAPRPASPAPLPSATTSRAPRPPDDEPNLALAVARTVNATAKTRRR